MPHVTPKAPRHLNDPQRRIWLASNPAGGYRHGRVVSQFAPSRGGHHKPMFDKAAAEQAALFGHQASRLARP